MLPEDDIYLSPEQMAAWRKHFEVLTDALAAPGISQEPVVHDPAPSMPLHAPEWLWEFMEEHLAEMESREIVWTGIERTYIAIQELPDADSGDYPAIEEYVVTEDEDEIWTRREIDKDRDFEGGSADLGDE